MGKLTISEIPLVAITAIACLITIGQFSGLLFFYAPRESLQFQSVIWINQYEFRLSSPYSEGAIGEYPYRKFFFDAEPSGLPSSLKDFYTKDISCEVTKSDGGKIVGEVDTSITSHYGKTMVTPVCVIPSTIYFNELKEVKFSFKIDEPLIEDTVEEEEPSLLEEQLGVSKEYLKNPYFLAILIIALGGLGYLYWRHRK